MQNITTISKTSLSVICKFLSPRDVIHLSRTCKSLYNTISDKNFSTWCKGWFYPGKSNLYPDINFFQFTKLANKTCERTYLYLFRPCFNAVALNGKPGSTSFCSNCLEILLARIY